MNSSDMELAWEYFPYLLINDREPFLPEAIGVHIYRSTEKSRSFRREIRVEGTTAFVIEYAVFFTYDIEHLYDLEHIWIYVGKDGQVLECESSFHGKFVKGLKPDRSNLIDQRVILFCQPGKHAFSAYRELLELDPGGYMRVPMSPDAVNGLLITGILEGRMECNDAVNAMVNRQLARMKFTPSATFHSYLCQPDIFMTWDLLNEKIPVLIQAELDRLNAMENPSNK
ncbi:MAG: hypothetical protein ACOX6P_05430 [Candidatus Merdivicinus sp.]|jgi:hypothetical protein